MEVLAAVNEGDDRARNCKQNNDDRRKPAYRHQSHDKADDADHVTDHAEGGVEYVDRAHSRLAVGVFQPCVKLGLVVFCKVDIPCLIHYLDLDVVGHHLTRNGGDDAAYLIDKAVDKQKSELPKQRHQDRDHKRAELHIAAFGNEKRGERVDEVCRYEGSDDGHDAVEHGHERHDEHEYGTCLPHQLEYVKKTVEKAPDQLLQIAGQVL